MSSKIKKSAWIILTLILIFSVVVVQGKSFFDNGLTNSESQLIFYDYVTFRDSTVHLSLISEIQNRFPPTNFAASGIALKNYHYLFDALVSLPLKIFPIPQLDYYFRVLPILLSSFLSIMIFLAAYKLTKNRLASTMAIFFVVFSTSFGSLMPAIKIFLHQNSVTGGNNMFMTDQIQNMMVNPQGVFSLGVFLALFLLLEKYVSSGKRIFLLVFSLVLGASFGIKAYGGVIFAISATCFSCYYFLLKRDFRPLLASTIGCILIAIWYLLTIDDKVAGVSFAPFWLLDAMMSDLDRVNEPRYALIKYTYQFLNDWKGLAFLTIRELSIYIVGSLGLRLFGLIGLIYLLKNFRKLSPSILFLISAAAASFSIPLFFNQSSKAYDIIQFSPYFTLFMGLMLTLSLYLVHKKLKKLGITSLVFLLLFLGTLFLDKQDLAVRLSLSADKIVFSKDILSAVEFVKTHTPVDSIFLLPINNFNNDYLWFSSLANRRTYYSGERFVSQVGVSSKDLKENISRISPENGCHMSFDFVFFQKSELGQFEKIKSACSLEIIFENSDAVIAKKPTPK